MLRLKHQNKRKNNKMDLQNKRGQFFSEYLQEMADSQNNNVSIEELDYHVEVTPESLIRLEGEDKLVKHFLK